MKQDRNNLVEKGWEKMLPTLEQELPQKDKQRVVIFWLMGILLLGTMSYTAWQVSQFENTQPEPFQNQSNLQSVSDGMADAEATLLQSHESINQTKPQSPTLENYDDIASTQKLVKNNTDIIPIQTNRPQQNSTFKKSDTQTKDIIAEASNNDEFLLQPTTAPEPIAEVIDDISHTPNRAILESVILVPTKSTKSLAMINSGPILPPIDIKSLTVSKWQGYAGIAYMHGISDNQIGWQLQGGVSKKWNKWHIGLMASIQNGITTNSIDADTRLSAEMQSNGFGEDCNLPFEDAVNINPNEVNHNFIPLECANSNSDDLSISTNESNFTTSLGLQITYDFNDLLSLSVASGIETNLAVNRSDVFSIAGSEISRNNNFIFGQVDSNFSINDNISLFAGYRFRPINTLNPLSKHSGLFGLKYTI